MVFGIFCLFVYFGGSLSNMDTELVQSLSALPLPTARGICMTDPTKGRKYLPALHVLDIGGAKSVQIVQEKVACRATHGWGVRVRTRREAAC